MKREQTDMKHKDDKRAKDNSNRNSEQQTEIEYSCKQHSNAIADQAAATTYTATKSVG